MDGAAASTAADGWEAVAPLPSTTAEDHGRGWEVVAAGASASAYDDYTIFPPSLHEGLHLPPDPDPEPAETLPPLPSSREPVGVLGGSYFSSLMYRTAAAPTEEEVELPSVDRWRPFTDSARRLIGSGLEVIHSNISLCRGGGGIGCLAGGKVWSLAAVAGLMGALMYLRRRHRREKELLLLLIQEKDQRISHLLNQISLMSELLAARHQVAVLRHL